MSRSLISSLLCGVAIVSAPGAALAQSTADGSVARVEEIVVTARKRQESIMNVPVVATAVGQAQLERFNTADLKSLATLVPGLTLGSSILSVGTTASLRGVGTSSLDPGVDASVALNIDGMALSQGLAYASGMFDIGQIEVLKGPQSLFYGKSSPGGVISLRTADPTDKFELIARAGYEFEARERRIEAIISGPVADGLKLRLAGTYGKQDGFFKNNAQAIPALGSKNPVKRRMSPAEDYKLRLTALWNPTDAFDVRLKINRVRDETLYPGTAQIVFCPEGNGAFNGRQFVDPNDCKFDRNIPLVDLDPAAFPGISNNGTPFNNTTQTFGTLEMNYKLQPGLILTSATGYYLANSESMINATMSSAGAGFISAQNRFQRRQITEEVRLTSDYSGPLNFTLGGYLERSRFYDFVTIGGNTKIGAPVRVQQGQTTVHVETESVFGQVLYKVVPQVEVALGARWTSERRNQEVVNTITGIAVPVNVLTPKIKANNIAPELSITYRPTDDLTIFGSLKRGYKSGSFNVSTPPTATTQNSFGDEKVEGGEAGIKTRLLDRTLLFNVAAYYYKYAGLQVGANVPSVGGVTQTRTVNAGQARNYGIEADVTYNPASVEGLTLRAAANWNNAKYTTLEGVPCYGGQMVSEGCNQVLNQVTGLFTGQSRSGVPLIRAPKFQANFGFDYEMPLSNGMSVVVASNNQYSSRFLTNLGYLYYQPSFIKADLSLTLKGQDDRWDLAFIGKNLNNKLTAGACANSNRVAGQTGGQITGGTVRGAAGIDEIGCYMDRGRELLVRATFRY